MSLFYMYLYFFAFKYVAREHFWAEDTKCFVFPLNVRVVFTFSRLYMQVHQIFTNLTFACQLPALPGGQSGLILSLDRVARPLGELFLRRPYSLVCNPVRSTWNGIKYLPLCVCQYSHRNLLAYNRWGENVRAEHTCNS